MFFCVFVACLFDDLIGVCSVVCFFMFCVVFALLFLRVFLINFMVFGCFVFFGVPERKHEKKTCCCPFCWGKA